MVNHYPTSTRSSFVAGVSTQTSTKESRKQGIADFEVEDDENDEEEEDDESYEIDENAELELRDATIKLIRLLANISIDQTVGLAVGSKYENLQVNFVFCEFIFIFLIFFLFLFFSQDDVGITHKL